MVIEIDRVPPFATTPLNVGCNANVANIREPPKLTVIEPPIVVITPAAAGTDKENIVFAPDGAVPVTGKRPLTALLPPVPALVAPLTKICCGTGEVNGRLAVGIVKVRTFADQDAELTAAEGSPGVPGGQNRHTFGNVIE